MRGRARPQMNALPTGARTASTLLQGLQLASPGVDAATAAGWAALDPAGMMQQFMAFQAQTSGQQQQQQQQLYGDASSFAADQAAFGTGFQVPLTFDATQLQLGDEDGSAAAFDNATTAFNDGRPFATESASVPAVLDTKRRKSSEDGDKRNVRAKHDVNVTTAYPYDPATDASSPRVAKHTPVVAVGHDGNGRKRGGQGM